MNPLHPGQLEKQGIGGEKRKQDRKSDEHMSPTSSGWRRAHQLLSAGQVNDGSYSTDGLSKYRPS